jgi:hypothetical protein
MSIAALFGALSSCSRVPAIHSGIVSVADLRSGSLPVAIGVCVQGVATYTDIFTGAVVVQDRTGGMRFGNVRLAGDLAGQQVEVCGETRPETGGMTLASPEVKILRGGKLPEPFLATPEAWSRHALDWQWVEIRGLAYAETVDHINHVSLHMVSDGRRIRVYVMGGSHPPVFTHLMGSWVRVRGVATRPADGDLRADLVLECPDRNLVTPETAVSPSTPPLIDVGKAIRLAGTIPGPRVRLRGSITSDGTDQALWFHDATGRLPLKLNSVQLADAENAEVAGFPVRYGSGVVLEGPVIASQQARPSNTPPSPPFTAFMRCHLPTPPQEFPSAFAASRPRSTRYRDTFSFKTGRAASIPPWGRSPSFRFPPAIC